MSNLDLSRFSLAGRCVIITGGSGGVGRAFARAFAQGGAQIFFFPLAPGLIPPGGEGCGGVGENGVGAAVDGLGVKHVSSWL